MSVGSEGDGTPPPSPHSGAKKKLGVTLRNIFSVVFTNFEFIKSMSVIGRKNLHGKVDITSGKYLNHNPTADICSFDR